MTPRARKALLSLMIPLAFAPAMAAADDDVPALLQFAERYQRQDAPAADAAVTPSRETQKPAPRPVQPRETSSQRKQLAQLQKTLREKEARLEQQQTAIQSLQQQLTALRVASSLTAADKPTVAPDLSALSDFASGVRRALNLTPQERKAQAQIAEAQAALAQEKQQTEERDRRIALLEQRLAALPEQADSAWQEKLTAAQTANDKARQRYEQDKQAAAAELAQQKAEAAKATGELQQQLALRQKELDEQRQQAERQEKSLKTALEQQKAETAKATGELQQQLAQLQEKNKTQTEQAKALAQRLATAVAESEKSTLQLAKTTEQTKKNALALADANQTQQALREELDGLRSRAKWLPDAQALEKKPAQQSYAAGVALGRDIQTMLAERKNWGINPDKTVLLAGVIDTFNGHYQLSDAQLTRALAESEKAVNDARNQAAKVQTSKGEAFVTEFKKKKGTQKSPSGFWYRIDYAGDEAIKENARVDIVVKESLTDGSVIQDMDRSGKVMSQPLSAYPPLFREAIGHLKNHGSLTMVVPPALAYGETGYAPQIPPDATMVYELRIVDVNNG
ncbi:FKBP-type peptidyl-prolyl cis-trans isomerase N-terminal domain-containing protein [Serratia marcescens]|uniref:FKBP-type peptidyl-prolyl cis-trans isomerase N-terminal domain-containing protein n=1 Tax=Serratia marcescens TaxID=615 RepID=UPI0027E5B178|nr:FKBP-type peptidyl-prolyl cis-trans isomerase N-terminal domain-containing protein [Serratia marcescens]MDI3225835.1 FKBP-type peptidyl-prolyl cis-trans isomerase N-terminal domain-containing protein [Serratia marcescens]HEN7339875.1 FKBP-type peptidyl-prolyl cis-trans isomerase [Serratia marcescens]HEN7343436.1 FKBP-type peptidyl-prolyl cis-trans isomerase [Serratia marcescens]HEN7410131.1 FKBP-type peptidyl-prolyl cis-trans isomerase [Serratia marcescens]HEN7413444.1 FKBP-type peptidyl-pr